MDGYGEGWQACKREGELMVTRKHNVNTTGEERRVDPRGNGIKHSHFILNIGQPLAARSTDYSISGPRAPWT